MRLSRQQSLALRKIGITIAPAGALNKVQIEVLSGDNGFLAGKGSAGAESGNFEVLYRVANANSQAGINISATEPGAAVFQIASTGTVSPTGFSKFEVVGASGGTTTLGVSTTATTCLFDVFVRAGNQTVYAGQVTG